MTSGTWRGVDLGQSSGDRAEQRRIEGASRGEVGRHAAAMGKGTVAQSDWNRRFEARDCEGE